MWNGTMFVDLDGPLNASSLLSASAELLVFIILRASEAVAQCMVIGPVCLFAGMWGVCLWICYHARNCVQRSSPNWVFR